jgi:hypothetical protein
MAAAILLMFSSYGRPGEVLALTRGHVIPPVKALGAAGAHWTINFHPKEFQVRSKTLIFDDSVVLDGEHSKLMDALLRPLVQERRGQEPLFSFSLQELTKAFQKAQETLQIPVRPLYSLRHSGPAHDHLQKTRTLSNIKKRGRWQSDRSVRRYEKSGRTAMLLDRLPEALITHCERCKEASMYLLARKVNPLTYRGRESVVKTKISRCRR